MSIPKIIIQLDTRYTLSRGLLKGITKYSRLHEPWVFYHDFIYIDGHWLMNTQDIALTTPNKLKSFQANGVIMRDTKENEKRLLNLGLPTVIIVGYKPITEDEHAYVITDQQKIGITAAEYFLERGFKNFGYCPFYKCEWSRERGESYTARIQQEGHEVDIFNPPSRRGSNSWSTELMALMQWVQSLPKPAAVLCCNDLRAVHLAEACKIVSIHIPEEVSLMGVDNDELLCDLAQPQMSSVALNSEKAGYEAAEVLSRMMKGKKVDHKIITLDSTHVVTRASTDITAIEDADVAEAIRFIRQSCPQNISVDDVVAVSTISRRTLQRRFKKVMGQSITEHIRSARIDYICKLLVETDMPISQIAILMGHYNSDHIARYFRQEKGMTLQQFRDQFQAGK